MSPSDATVDTRTALIEAATTLMLERGWTGFSYADLAEQVGIRKASIHYHFPAKEDLGLAILRAWQELWSGIHDQAEQDHPRVPERFAAMIAFFAEHTAQGQICPPGALDADYLNLPERIQHEVRAWCAERLARYAKWLEEGRAQDSLRFTGKAEDQAIAMLGGFQGAMQIDRTMDNGALARFVQHFMQSMQV